MAGTCFHTHTQTFKGVRNRENEQAFSKIRKEKLERHIKLQAAIHVSNFILIWNIWICFKATSTVWAHRRCSIPTLSAYNLPHWQKKALFCCKSCPLPSRVLILPAVMVTWRRLLVARFLICMTNEEV